MSDLIDDFITVWNDGVQLLEGLETFVVVVQSLVDETEIVDGFNAISFDTDGFKEELFGAVVVFGIVEAVTFVHQSFGVISVVLNG